MTTYTKIASIWKLSKRGGGTSNYVCVKGNHNDIGKLKTAIRKKIVEIDLNLKVRCYFQRKFQTCIREIDHYHSNIIFHT